MEGVLIFDYKGKRREIPYSTDDFGGGDSRLYLTDKKGCVHIVDFVDGKWMPLWDEQYPDDFKEILDWVIKQQIKNPSP